MIDMKRAEDWVGRTEVAWGKLTPQLAGMLKAAVGHRKFIDRDTRNSALLPRLWHWAAFPEFVPLSNWARTGIQGSGASCRRWPSSGACGRPGG